MASASHAPRPLREYHAKRHFDRTPEPAGDPAAAAAVGSASGSRFVIQKHAARRLHYDFRLELDGVLLSWSVPKGPSLAPTTRRLAMRTEDHPIEYADFEGIIPAGEYGGGTVVVWDRGRWRPDGDPRAGLEKGRLTFDLEGDKLHGRWHLVRTKGDGKGEPWLLFKGRDDHASDDGDITAERPDSVVSGRSLEEVGAARDRVWHSKRASAPADAPGDLRRLVASLPVGFPLTNLDKVLYPEQGVSKAELIAYLAVVSEWLLPHVADRPLTLVRCPDGAHRHCFFQKHTKPGMPEAIVRIPITEDDGTVAHYLMIRDLAGLIATAQLGALELHTWGCHADKVERPDLLIFDLDPDEGLAWARVVEGARELRQRLADLGLDSVVKTTGGKGLHVVVPVTRAIAWDDFKGFARAVAEGLAADHPDRYTANPLKAQRRGRIFVDYLRNGRGATAIAPYSPRARAGATVAVPVAWDELDELDPSSLTIATVPSWLGTRAADPWAEVGAMRQRITVGARRAAGATR